HEFPAVPPEAVSVVEEPLQTVVVPVIAFGAVEGMFTLIVTTLDEAAPVHPELQETLATLLYHVFAVNASGV
ncbi:MAG: hypothetical protein WCJ95_15635, partial [Mariniphaga sp.]